MTYITNERCEKSSGLLNTEFGETYTDMVGAVSGNMMCAASLGKDAVSLLDYAHLFLFWLYLMHFIYLILIYYSVKETVEAPWL